MSSPLSQPPPGAVHSCAVSGPQPGASGAEFAPPPGIWGTLIITVASPSPSPDDESPSPDDESPSPADESPSPSPDESPSPDDESPSPLPPGESPPPQPPSRKPPAR